VHESTHPFTPRASLHCPSWCITIARLLGSIQSLLRSPVFMPYTIPYWCKQYRVKDKLSSGPRCPGPRPPTGCCSSWSRRRHPPSARRARRCRAAAAAAASGRTPAAGQTPARRRRRTVAAPASAGGRTPASCRSHSAPKQEKKECGVREGGG